MSDVMAGETVSLQKNAALHDTYERLKASFPQVGPFETGRYLGGSGAGAWILDFDGLAAIVGPTTWDPVCFEIHGGIYSAWKASGGVLGPLGRPVSDEADYHGPDARPGDRISEFENGVAVWRADTYQTELRGKSEANAPFDIIIKFREKHDLLKRMFPKIGEAIEPGIYRTPNGGWQCNYANCAAITIRPGDSEAHEVYGGICARWYQEGGAFDETCKPGWLGFPISGVEAFHDLGDSKDRISHFENGDIVWIANNNETRIVNSRISKEEFMERVQKLSERVHEKVVEIIAIQLGVDRHQISRNSSLAKDLQADDLDLNEIIMAFEEEFGVEIPTTLEENKYPGSSYAIARSSYPLAGYTLSLSIGDTVGEIEQYLIEHSHPWDSDAGSFTDSADSSVDPDEFVVDPDACVMENMERAIAAGYSEDEARAMFLGV